MESNWRQKKDKGDNSWYPSWRYKALIVLEVVLSVALLVAGHILNNAYVRGVGVGLLIAWVTGGLAYLIYVRGSGSKGK
jgi:hypothetical protein